MNKKGLKILIKKLNRKELKKDFLGLIEYVGFIDILYVMIIPFVLLIIMLFPSFIRNSMKFHIYESHWWQFITHAFVHADFTHLLNNVKSYFLFVFIGLLLASQIDMKKQYYTIMAIITLSFPIISSILEFFVYPYIMPSLLNSSGSSGIASGLLGFIPFFWILVLSKKIKKNLLDFNFFNIVIIYVALLFAIIYASRYKNVWFMLVVLLAEFYFVFKYRYNFKSIGIAIICEGRNNILNYFFMFFVPFFFLVGPLVLFPIKIFQENNMIDFFMHYIGLIYGIIICFTYLKLEKRKAPDSF